MEERQNIIKKLRQALQFLDYEHTLRLGKGRSIPPSTGEAMSNSSPERNKAIVLEAFEATKAESVSGLPMFGDAFPK
jgi:hypothetical protein